MYFTVPFSYLLLFIIFIRGVTLEGAGEGLKYFLTPDLNRITSISVRTAAVTVLVPPPFARLFFPDSPQKNYPEKGIFSPLFSFLLGFRCIRPYRSSSVDTRVFTFPFLTAARTTSCGSASVLQSCHTQG